MPETELSNQVGELITRIDRALDVLDRERFWRRVAAVLVVAGFVSVVVFISYSRQADCDRNNRAREQIRAANVAGFGTAWDEIGPADPSAKADLLGEIARDQEALLPARDCRWPA
jgi:hypothetical protein